MLQKARGGRPSKKQAGEIEDKIFEAAKTVFFTEGYGSASIEEISKKAHISKRTFYARFKNKSELFEAVVHKIIQNLRPQNEAVDKIFEGKNVEEILLRIAPILLKASLSEEALSLQRLLLAEATRFPELALIMNEQSARQEALIRIASVLRKKDSVQSYPTPDTLFMAEQFLIMVTSSPQRRSLGLGLPMTKEELQSWAQKTVTLFLKGYEKSM